MFCKTRYLSFFLLVSHCAFAGLQVPSVLSDGLVLQQIMPSKVWGSGTIESTVSVTLMRADDLSVVASSVAAVDVEGSWQVSLDGQPASYSKYIIRIEDGQDLIEIQNVLFGEVWMVSGQSNMNLALKYISNHDEIESAINTAGNEYIRGLNSKNAIVVGATACSQTPLDDIPGAHWGSATNFDGVADLSGVGVTFALKLFDYLNQNGNKVPIAILTETRGATNIRAWLI
jgi:sialate O-acetylesterase